jgi:pyrimidine-specific ribonucleoside hydrolase
MDRDLDVVVDGGVDDALALAVLVGSGVHIRQAVATEGSISAEVTAAVTARLLRLLGCDAPVRLGATSGLSGPYPAGRDPFHGVDGFGGASAVLPEVEGPTASWVSLGPDVFVSGALTVPARALANGERIERLCWMGGAITCGGNMSAAAEFNAWMDPRACDAVLRCGARISVVPLDVTTRITFGRSEVLQIAELGVVGRALAAAMSPMVERDGYFIPHDAVAAIADLRPELFEWGRRWVRCETAGVLTSGALVVDRRPTGALGSTEIAEDVNDVAVAEAVVGAIRALVSPDDQQ